MGGNQNIRGNGVVAVCANHQTQCGINPVENTAELLTHPH